MSEKQKAALKAYDKIKIERGEVTFIDAFIEGCEYTEKRFMEKAERYFAEWFKYYPQSYKESFDDFKQFMAEK